MRDRPEISVGGQKDFSGIADGVMMKVLPQDFSLRFPTELRQVRGFLDFGDGRRATPISLLPHSRSSLA